MLLSRRRAHIVRVRWKELADASVGEFLVCAATYRFYAGIVGFGLSAARQNMHLV